MLISTCTLQPQPSKLYSVFIFEMTDGIDDVGELFQDAGTYIVSG